MGGGKTDMDDSVISEITNAHRSSISEAAEPSACPRFYFMLMRRPKLRLKLSGWS